MTRLTQEYGFHPLVSEWFTKRYGAPTAVQDRSWRPIAAGKNVLVTAPTGSGKTLVAFLWALHRLISGEWPTGVVRVLYISPLRALNNDIRRNLRAPLGELADLFASKGQPFPDIRAMTRSGDTPPSERRKMLRTPPEILITTPESLNILLTSPKGIDLLGHLQTVILDEVHAVAGSKRGTHLITGVERLTRLSGEFQRIALSATVCPLQSIASWVGGYQQVPGTPGGFTPRPVSIIDARGDKKYDVTVHRAQSQKPRPEAESTGHSIWFALADEVAKKVNEQGATLVFANSRRTVERVARLVNTEGDERIVYSHHGSLSREIREVVEERLKAGELKGIVATNSLELGIDVGAVNQVLLVETPPSVSATVQRIGRAGHSVGETSRGILYPLHGNDYVDAAVVMKSVLTGEVEPLSIPSCPLDVLAQVILSMTAMESFSLDDLYHFIRTAAPYHDLQRRPFDLVIQMLAGKYEGTRVPELKPRIAWDQVDNTIKARPGVARLLYASGGTIPDRGYYTVRLADTGAPIGELDEEFVFERAIGETLSLGVQSWRIQRIGYNDVFVSPAGRSAAMTPFWRCEERFHDFWYAERRGQFLEAADPQVADPGFIETLKEEHGFSHEAAISLADYLSSQKAATKCALPHRHHIVLEHVAPSTGSLTRPFTVLHVPWGGQITRPLALALSAACEKHLGHPVGVMYEDGCVALELIEPPTIEELLSLVPLESIDTLVAKKLETTGFFGAHFRENAARSLILLKAGFHRRTPLWQNRKRAKELMEAVSRYKDFPVLLETWRSCLQDEVNLDGLKKLLEEVKDGTIETSTTVTRSPSPFASEILWKRTSELMYQDDVPTSQKSSLATDLIDEVVFQGALRPRIPIPIITELTAKLKRTYPGYAPRSTEDLIEWVKERVFIPAPEWGSLMEAMQRDWQLSRDAILTGIAHRVVALPPANPGGISIVCSVELAGELYALFGPSPTPPKKKIEILSARLDGSEASPEGIAAARKIIPLHGTGDEAGDTRRTELLAQWLRYDGPVSTQHIKQCFQISESALKNDLATLEQNRQIVVDQVSSTAVDLEIIDAENLARLLRIKRARSRPRAPARDIGDLPRFLADHHGLGTGEGDRSALEGTLERLFGYAADPSLFETEFLPARLPSYRTAWLDDLFATTDLVFTGHPGKKVSLCLAPDRELLSVPTATEEERALMDRILPAGPGKYAAGDLLLSANPPSSSDLTVDLWRLSFAGLITNDTFESVRQGAARGFKSPIHKVGGRPRLRRPRHSKWCRPQGAPGNWYRLPMPRDDWDPLEEEELKKERARLLLDRYGVLFRELLRREGGNLRWGQLFRTLRLMELSGEVVAGQFFKGILGVQFISNEGFKRFEGPWDNDRIFWINAADPLAATGLGLEGLVLPRRVPGTHLVFHGKELVVVSRRRGREIEFRVPHDASHLLDYCSFLQALMTRDASPLPAITIEAINGESALTSPYRGLFESIFETSHDHRALQICKKR